MTATRTRPAAKAAMSLAAGDIFSSPVLDRLRKYARAVLGQQVAGRGLTVYPDDTFLVSYPRSGNTWLRFLITNLAFPGEPATFVSLERRTPEIYAHSEFVLRRTPRPRIIKSHECFDPRYKRAIYLARDPRDVAVSFYHFSLKKRWLPDGYPQATFVRQWMEARWKTDYGTWAEHVQSWLTMRRGSDGFLLVRYEDLQASTSHELARIATFLGLERSDDEVRRAVELSSADRMRALEKKQQKRWATTKRSRLDKPFVRKAKAGDWRTALPRESVELIEAAWGPLMESLGYQLTARASDAAPDASPTEPSAQVPQ